jgi:hypothetical protein
MIDAFLQAQLATKRILTLDQHGNYMISSSNTMRLCSRFPATARGKSPTVRGKSPAARALSPGGASGKPLGGRGGGGGRGPDRGGGGGGGGGGGARAGGSRAFCDVAVQFDGPPLPLDSSRNLIRFLHKTIVLLLVFVGIQLLVAKTL